jgi:hypothetical protein
MRGGARTLRFALARNYNAKNCFVFYPEISVLSSGLMPPEGRLRKADPLRGREACFTNSPLHRPFRGEATAVAFGYLRVCSLYLSREAKQLVIPAKA